MINLDNFVYPYPDEALKKMPYFWKKDDATSLDKSVWVSYMEVIFNALLNYLTEIQNQAALKLAFLNVTGQVLSLENYLNNTYDNTLRRIYITISQTQPPYGETWVLASETDSSPKTWVLTSEIDITPTTMYLSNEFISYTYFTVNIPTDVVFVESKLRAELSNYVLATKLYNILTF